MPTAPVEFDDLHVLGNFTVGGVAHPSDATIDRVHFKAAAAIKRVKLAQDTLQKFPIDLSSARIWDSLSSIPTGVAGADDVAMEGNAGTSSMYLSAGDLNAAGSINRYARFIFYMPPSYDPLTTANIVAHAGVTTQAADDHCNLDMVVHKCDKFGVTVSSDLVSTAAQSINTTTYADYSFALTTTALGPGDMLDLRIEFDAQDDNAGLTVDPRIGALWIACDIRG